jgi:glutaminyl-tRNA synthetase
MLEPALTADNDPAAVQFERLGYFCRDPDSAPGNLVFNRTIGLRDSYARAAIARH